MNKLSFKEKIRTRFAPSPTGFLHLGNIRVALVNFLFAKQNDGDFILRIEDTDPTRNFDPGAKQIISDLKWLKIDYSEGPQKDGEFSPYFQSKRTEIYKTFLEKLEKKDKIYRCFCPQEKLEEKKKIQIALKLPPRYDKTCTKLCEKKISSLVQEKTPFIWRLRIPSGELEIEDLAKGKVSFDLKNFYDFAITRPDGSFTFMFANFVDDVIMKVTHVIRGEDHLSNTALQVVLYKIFDKKIPIFFHLPIICNIDGKKLSKRDFGFSLNDLRMAGFLNESICNYLANMGTSFENEIMDLEAISKKIDFQKSNTKSQVKHDPKKLLWFNQKWISKLDIQDLTERCLPYLEKEFPEIKNIPKIDLKNLIGLIQPNLTTLKECTEMLRFYFKAPVISKEQFKNFEPQILEIFEKMDINNLKETKQFCLEHKIKLQNMCKLVRLVLTGTTEGFAISEILEILPKKEVEKRVNTALKTLHPTTI